MLGKHKHEHQFEKVNPETGKLQVFTVYQEGSSLTQQQWKDDCDINLIIKKYTATGENPHKNRNIGVYADVSQIPDYQGMLDTVKYAEEAFMTLPAEARARFQNNPAELISFMQDPNNFEEGVSLGLFEPKPIEPDLIPDKQTNKNSKTNDKKSGKNQSHGSKTELDDSAES